MTRMHMPGHKGNTALVPSFLKKDITEITGFDNLHSPTGIIKDIEDDAALIWHASSAVISVNGATAPILASVTAASSYGKILIASNCHISVWHALEISGAEFDAIDPSTDPQYPFFLSVDPSKIKDILNSDPSIRTVVITSPTYEGVLSDVESIYKITQESGATLIVDASHGSHLGLNEYFPDTQAADVVIKSLHKTLHSPTQTALLLTYSERISESLIRHYMDIYESSSPSYLLMEGIGRVLKDILSRPGLTGTWAGALENCRNKLRNELCHIKLFELEGADPSKLVLLTGDVIDGTKLAALLKEEGVEVEASFEDYLIAMTGIGDNEETLMKFTSALIKIDSGLTGEAAKTYKNFIPESKPEYVMTIRDAVRSPYKALPKEECEGKISASYVFRYPPGIPVLIPGQKITEDRLKLISDASLKVVSG